MARLKGDNAHLQALASARWDHVIASTTKTVLNKAGVLQKIVLNTNGGVVIVRNGSEVIASIAADAPEGAIDYGIYCNNSIIVETGATCDVTVVFDV
jgi:hypothetical protein